MLNSSEHRQGTSSDESVSRDDESAKSDSSSTEVTISTRTESTEHSLLEYGQVVNEEWQVRNKLGEGGFGAVYAVYSDRIRDVVAMKVESTKAKAPVMRMETGVLKRLQGKQHFCRWYGSGRNESFTFLVMEMTGRDLGKIKRLLRKERFSLSTTIRLAIQGLEALQEIHSLGFIHRDVKPSNFALGVGPRQRTLLLLDFGLARRFVDDFGVRPHRRSVGFRGTVRYASPNTHKYRECGQVDDLWSLFYMILEFCIGRLPWRDLDGKRETMYMKEDCILDLLDGPPAELCRWYISLRKTRSEERPNYDLLASVLKDIMERKGYKVGDIFDWEDPMNLKPTHEDEFYSACSSLQRCDVPPDSNIQEDESP